MQLLMLLRVFLENKISIIKVLREIRNKIGSNEDGYYYTRCPNQNFVGKGYTIELRDYYRIRIRK